MLLTFNFERNQTVLPWLPETILAPIGTFISKSKLPSAWIHFGFIISLRRNLKREKAKRHVIKSGSKGEKAKRHVIKSGSKGEKAKRHVIKSGSKGEKAKCHVIKSGSKGEKAKRSVT